MIGILDMLLSIKPKAIRIKTLKALQLEKRRDLQVMNFLSIFQGSEDKILQGAILKSANSQDASSKHRSYHPRAMA